MPQLAEPTLNQFAEQAAGITADFLEKAKSDLRTYSLMLAAGKYDEDEFESAVREKMQIVKLKLLELNGIPGAAVDDFMDGLVDTLVTIAINTIL